MSFRILAFSDWRSQPLDLLDAVVRDVGALDLIVYAGDDVRRLVDTATEVAAREVVQRRLDSFGEPVSELVLPACHVINGGRLAAVCLEGGSNDRHTLQARLTAAIDRWRELLPGPEDGFAGSWWMQQQAKRMQDNFLRLLAALALPTDDPSGALAQALLERGQVVSAQTMPPTTLVTVALGHPVNKLAELARYARLGLVGIIGNDCLPADADLLGPEPFVRNLHVVTEHHDGWGFVGQQGAVGTIGYTLSSEDEVAAHLGRQMESVPSHLRGVVLVTHCPPYGALDLGLRFGVERIGSRAIADLCQRGGVSLVICGHAHASGGRVARLGGALVVNVASHDEPGAEGRMALIELPHGQGGDVPEAAVTWLSTARFRLTSLSRVGPVREKRLLEAGISSPRDVLFADTSALARIAGVSLTQIAHWHQDLAAQQAQSPILRSGRRAEDAAKVLASLRCPPLIVDIETGVSEHRDEVWLIGALDPGSGEVVQFYAQPRRGRWRGLDRAALWQFVTFLRLQPDRPICCYAGTGFDHRRILDVLGGYDPGLAAEYSARERIDICALARRVAASPCGGWRLKPVATTLGYPFVRDDLDGFAVGLAYEAHRSLGEPLDAAALLAYNADDVKAAAFVAEMLRRLCVYCWSG